MIIDGRWFVDFQKACHIPDFLVECFWATKVTSVKVQDTFLVIFSETAYLADGVPNLTPIFLFNTFPSESALRADSHR